MPRAGKRLSAIVALAAVLAVAAGAMWMLEHQRRGDRKPPRFVLLYAPCTVSKRFLAPYNPTVTYTPNLAKFAASALVFRRHQTEAGKSGVAYASLLSGTQAMEHGVYFHPTPLPDSLYLLTEFFRDAGYEPYFWNDQLMAGPDINYAQGVPPENIFRKPLSTREPDFERLLQRLASDPQAKAFVFTNFSVTHAPYSAQRRAGFCRFYPQQCQGLSEADFKRFAPLISGREELLDFVYDFDRACQRHGLTPSDVRTMAEVVRVLYESNVHYLDSMFGLILDRIRSHGLMDQSLIVFTADHGEVLQRENAIYKWTHGFALEPEVLEVPLLVYGAEVRPGFYEGTTRSIDVYPTLAGLMGKPLPPGRVRGVDLSNALRGEEPAPELEAFMHSALPHASELATGYPSLLSRFPRQDPRFLKVAVRDGDRVYELPGAADEGKAAVYDWHADPDALHDLYDPGDASQAAVFRRLVKYQEELIEAYDRTKAQAADHLPTKREEELLRSLGYLDAP